MNKLLMLRNYMARNKKNLCGYRIKEKGVYLEWWDESPNSAMFNTCKIDVNKLLSPKYCTPIK
jgi:hypothetical protein